MGLLPQPHAATSSSSAPCWTDRIADTSNRGGKLSLTSQVIEAVTNGAGQTCGNARMICQISAQIRQRAALQRKQSAAARERAAAARSGGVLTETAVLRA